MRRHTDYETMVAAYHLLSAAERAELDAHVGECSACAADLAAYRRMDVELRGLQGYQAGAAMRMRVSEAIGERSALAPAPAPIRPIVRAPVIRKAKRARQPWTWTRALAPVGFVLLFALVIGLSLPRNGANNEAEVLQPLPQPPVAAPPEQAQIVELTFSCDIAAYTDYNAWYKALADFEAENPDVQVSFTPEIISASDTASYEEGMAGLAARTDVFCAMPGLDDLRAGVIMDLAPYIANDPEFQPEDFYPSLLRTWQTGEILSIPTYFKPLLINYNPEAFDKAGAPYPRPGWTWDEFVTAASALTRRSGNEVEQWGYFEVGAFLFTSHLWNVWGDDFQTPPDYATMGELLRSYQKLYVETGAANVPLSLSAAPGKQYENRSLEMLLRAGKVAMWEAGWVSSAREPRHLATYPAPIAGNHVGRMSDMVMSGRTAHPDEAWRLLSYLSRHLPDAEVPARRSLAEKASFWNGLDESSTAAYRYMLDHAMRPYTPLPSEYMFYQEAAVRVAKGEKTVEQALADLDMQVTLRGGPAETNASPFIGIPDTSAHLVQNDGEGLLDFMARIALEEIAEWPHDALVVESEVESTENLYQGVSTKKGRSCWPQSDKEAQFCNSGDVSMAVGTARNAGRPVIYFGVASARSSEMLILYDIYYEDRPDDPVDGYRVVIRLEDGKWREGKPQRMY